MTWRFAGVPTSIESSVKATKEGVVLAPSEFSITRTFFPSITATQLLVVPKSIPMISAPEEKVRLGAPEGRLNKGGELACHRRARIDVVRVRVRVRRRRDTHICIAASALVPSVECF